ncbi:hypothetical protein [Actinomadura gamaensis]|uniref:DUF4232 domain-containing protein n=1 Tax=Actinomadura gamaensis TaxID=1763541 RepID=A0ABV9UA84_9ACTN
MDADTERDPEEWEADRYWRRRAIALAGVLGVVGLAAWACGALTGGNGDVRKQGVESVAGIGSAVPTSVATSPPAPTPTVTVTTTAKITISPTARPRPGDACDPRDVVVNLASTRDTFAGGARPTFRLTAVNTGQRACTYDVGPGNLDVRITSGADRVWAASACATGSGSSVHMLKRGIPYVTMLSWDRRRSGDDCKGARDKAMPGTYVASVKGDQVRTGKQIFHLR